eukprot:4337519-Prymnesium_polylepis.1
MAGPTLPRCTRAACRCLALGLDPGSRPRVSSELQRMHRPPWLLPCCASRCNPSARPLHRCAWRRRCIPPSAVPPPRPT